jgi:hypothetical protein
MRDVSFSTEDMSLTRLQKRFVHAGEVRQKALLAGLERGRQAVKVSDLLRYQSVLRLLMSGRPMLSLREMADLLRTSNHPQAQEVESSARLARWRRAWQACLEAHATMSGCSSCICLVM